MKHWRGINEMKVFRNYNCNDLFCVFTKEPIEIGEKYIEVTEICLGEEIIKTYAYDQMDNLVEEHLEIYDTPPEICEGE